MIKIKSKISFFELAQLQYYYKLCISIPEVYLHPLILIKFVPEIVNKILLHFFISNEIFRHFWCEMNITATKLHTPEMIKSSWCDYLRNKSIQFQFQQQLLNLSDLFFCLMLVLYPIMIKYINSMHLYYYNFLNYHYF